MILAFTEDSVFLTETVEPSCKRSLIVPKSHSSSRRPFVDGVVGEIEHEGRIRERPSVEVGPDRVSCRRAGVALEGSHQSRPQPGGVVIGTTPIGEFGRLVVGLNPSGRCQVSSKILRVEH